jgi:membrane protease YdiL (CAAX protease family)
MLVMFGILLVWLANGSGGSILFAVLAHTGFNTVLGVVPGSTVRDAAALLGLTAAASAAIILTRGELCFPSIVERDQHGGPDPHVTSPPCNHR